MGEQQPLETSGGKIQEWIQDNLRIIVSIFVVLVVAGGIYSYSKRTEIAIENNQDQTQITEELNEEGVVSSDNTLESKTETEKAPVAVSQETENSFIESAIKGEGTTHLARRALANYLEKNPDSTLTPEHKIYIEDYLRKNINLKSGIKIGTSVEFSKDLIQDAITKSKTLNDSQLKNLHKYAVRVPSLT